MTTSYPAGMPDWARPLDLRPHPEGGWYRQTYRSDLVLEPSVLPDGYPGPRPSATTILFLLLPGESSAWHRVRSDELWMHQHGGRLALHLGGRGDEPALAKSEGADPGDVCQLTLGPDLRAGGRFQALVPGGVWQSARPLEDEAVLVGCCVTPGFDFADFSLQRGEK
ncbi:MAG: cupin domain-containing protein [Micrococcales bacterium]|nr:cupin domain-containing protein [Micrococcales bacterium]